MATRILLLGPSHPGWAELETSIAAHPSFHLVVAIHAPEKCLAIAEQLRPDAILVASELPGHTLVPMVYGLRRALPATRIIVIGPALAPNSTAFPDLEGLGLPGNLIWEDTGPVGVLRALASILKGTRVAREAVTGLCGTRAEQRRGSQLDSLARHANERAGDIDARIGHRDGSPRVTLWEGNADIAALVRAACARVGLNLTRAATAQACLNAADSARPGDIVLLDCSRGLPEDWERCVAVITRTSIRTYIIHPRRLIVEELATLSSGDVIWLAPEDVGLPLLERLRALNTAISQDTSGYIVADVVPPTHHLTEREAQVLNLRGDGLNNSQIARRLDITRETVRSHLHNIRRKLEPDAPPRL